MIVVLQIASVLKGAFFLKIPKNSLGMVFADPPYFLFNGTFTYQNGKVVSVKKVDWDLNSGTEKNFEFYKEWIK